MEFRHDRGPRYRSTRCTAMDAVFDPKDQRDRVDDMGEVDGRRVDDVGEIVGARVDNVGGVDNVADR